MKKLLAFFRMTFINIDYESRRELFHSIHPIKSDRSQLLYQTLELLFFSIDESIEVAFH